MVACCAEAESRSSAGQTHDSDMSTLHLIWTERQRSRDRTRVRFVDFVIDGHSLLSRTGDRVTQLGWGAGGARQDALAALMVMRPPDLPSGRVALYVCPECGDLGCGAVGAFVERSGDAIVWRSFAYENNYDGLAQTEEYSDLGPFSFAAAEYLHLLQSYDAGDAG